jgi:hypothetical protein
VFPQKFFHLSLDHSSPCAQSTPKTRRRVCTIFPFPKLGLIKQIHKWLDFQVPESPVLFAGSRHGQVAEQSAKLLVQGFHLAGFSCSTGCASGIDQVFRSAFSSEFNESVPDLVACAFSGRTAECEQLGLNSLYVSKPYMYPHEALRHRTIWLVKQCSLLVLFPDDPKTGNWGKGSRLAFHTAKRLGKPSFVVSAKPPVDDPETIAQEANLFGLFWGTWVIPKGSES